MVGEGFGVGGLLARLVDMLAVDVADSRHVQARGLHELRHDVGAAVACADYPELHPVISPEYSGVGGRRERGRATDERPPGKLFRIHVRIIPRHRTSTV